MNGKLAQRVIDRQDGSAGISEDSVDASPTSVAHTISAPVRRVGVVRWAFADCVVAVVPMGDSFKVDSEQWAVNS
jgi:hypothetical protein